MLLSGGIDSTTLLAKLSGESYEIVAISFQYGQKHEIELTYARMNAEKYGVAKHHIIQLDEMLFKSSALVNTAIDIEPYKDKNSGCNHVNAYVPFRNLVFISMALSLAESVNINEVYLAVNSDDNANFWDCRTDFIQKINGITGLNTSIQIKTPFISLSKTEVVKLARELNVDLDNTITCYQPVNEVECGVCLSCMTRQTAIKNN